MKQHLYLDPEIRHRLVALLVAVAVVPMAPLIAGGPEFLDWLRAAPVFAVSAFALALSAAPLAALLATDPVGDAEVEGLAAQGRLSFVILHRPMDRSIIEVWNPANGPLGPRPILLRRFVASDAERERGGSWTHRGCLLRIQRNLLF